MYALQAQALAIASYYREEWPLLIITPASIRAMWAEEVERWYPFLVPKDIHIITSRYEYYCYHTTVY
jgi:SNF2 family DNA or RNA helicase